MSGRRLFRDAPLPEGRITLGERALKAAQVDVNVRSDRAQVRAQGEVRPQAQIESGARVELGAQPDRTAQVEALASELQAAKARIELLDAALEEHRQKLQTADAGLGELRSSVEAERAAAREQGHAAGLERAEAAIRLELQKQLDGWQRSVENMLRANDERWRALHAELTDIVLASATKLIGDQLVSPHAIRACVEHVMRESGITAPSRVLLAPGQYDQLTKLGGAHLAWFKDRRVEIAPDARVTHGGCILETPSGLIDGRYEVQLGRLREIVAAHYAPAPVGS